MNSNGPRTFHVPNVSRIRVVTELISAMGFVVCLAQVSGWALAAGPSRVTRGGHQDIAATGSIIANSGIPDPDSIADLANALRKARSLRPNTTKWQLPNSCEFATSRHARVCGRQCTRPPLFMTAVRGSNKQICDKQWRACPAKWPACGFTIAICTLTASATACLTIWKLTTWTQNAQHRRRRKHKSCSAPKPVTARPSLSW